MWVLNAGIVVFDPCEAAGGVAHGAAVVGGGMLLGVGLMLYRSQTGGVETADGTVERVP